MKASLQLKMNQQLAMTPQLQQAIRLLQLSTLDLQQEIQQALDSNPLLELEEELERRKLARDERRSAWMLTKAFNQAGKATDKAIKSLTAKPKAMKTLCRCEVQCFKYKCRCATNCMLVK